jgi:hypothetical protein
VSCPEALPGFPTRISFLPKVFFWGRVILCVSRLALNLQSFCLNLLSRWDYRCVFSTVLCLGYLKSQQWKIRLLLMPKWNSLHKRTGSQRAWDPNTTTSALLTGIPGRKDHIQFCSLTNSLAYSWLLKTTREKHTKRGATWRGWFWLRDSSALRWKIGKGKEMGV